MHTRINFIKFNQIHPSLMIALMGSSNYCTVLTIYNTRAMFFLTVRVFMIIALQKTTVQSKFHRQMKKNRVQIHLCYSSPESFCNTKALVMHFRSSLLYEYDVLINEKCTRTIIETQLLYCSLLKNCSRNCFRMVALSVHYAWSVPHCVLWLNSSAT